METKKSSNYLDKVHRIGRIGSIVSVAFMLGIPAVICTIFDIWPSFSEIVAGVTPLLAIFLPVAISEVFSYTPILGTSSYIAFITGNIMNLKLPVAINAMQIVDATQGTESGDAISAVAVSFSSIITMLIIALGTVMLLPLEPLLSNPNVTIATQYMLPALFGGLFIPQLLNKNAGEYRIEGKSKLLAVPVILVLAVHFFVTSIVGKEGIIMLIAIPVTILIAYILYKKGIVKMVSRVETKKE